MPMGLCMVSCACLPQAGVSATNLVNKNEREKVPKEFSK